ncbi:Ribonuclease H protein [Abeliophyllum distichum]|uniref:Ribonuclease H protein n=1 Tax=Abeliophyllum distichum TaxID=126358 RepID=A0ABD1V2E0_9LAMI
MKRMQLDMLVMQLEIIIWIVLLLSTSNQSARSGRSEYELYHQFTVELGMRSLAKGSAKLGYSKINTDGCVKYEFASRGGIIRDSLGQCVHAFFSLYRKCPILEAELRAILAQRIVLSDLWIESDSTLAIHCIIRGGGPWSIQATLRHIRHLLAFNRDTISHIFREGNQVVNLLASKGWNRHCNFEYSAKDLPQRYRSLIHIDRHGLPTHRSL